MIFELSWSWYEEYSPTLFSHNTKTTEEEFTNDIKILIDKYGEEYLKDETSWAGGSGLIDFIGTKLPELGYELVRPISFNVFGAYIVEGGTEDDDEFEKIIGTGLYNKFIEHNKIIRENMHNVQ